MRKSMASAVSPDLCKFYLFCIMKIQTPEILKFFLMKGFLREHSLFIEFKIVTFFFFVHFMTSYCKMYMI